LALPSRDEKHGTIEAIFRFADSGALGELLSSARLIAGVGIDGDRYALGKGHFQSEGRWGQALTLIEVEAIEFLASEHDVEMSAVDARRNIVTRGIDLNALMGQRFRVGGILCQGSRLAEPCAWLQRTTPPGMLRGLVHRGGLRADILEDGEIRRGDKITPVTSNRSD
jgi:MOSC domain-containing protein YiiM